MTAKEQLAAQEVAVAKQAGAVGMQETAERANRLEQELAVAKTTATTAQVRPPKLTVGFSQSSYILMTYRVGGAGRG